MPNKPSRPRPPRPRRPSKSKMASKSSRPRKRSRWLRTTDSVGRHPTAWKSAVAVLGSIGAIVGGFLLIDEHYEHTSDAKAHAQADDVRALWSQLGTTQLRASFLEDKVYDLAARKA